MWTEGCNGNGTAQLTQKYRYWEKAVLTARQIAGRKLSALNFGRTVWSPQKSIVRLRDAEGKMSEIRLIPGSHPPPLLWPRELNDSQPLDSAPGSGRFDSSLRLLIPHHFRDSGASVPLKSIARQADPPISFYHPATSAAPHQPTIHQRTHTHRPAPPPPSIMMMNCEEWSVPHPTTAPDPSYEFDMFTGFDDLDDESARGSRDPRERTRGQAGHRGPAGASD